MSKILLKRDIMEAIRKHSSIWNPIKIKDIQITQTHIEKQYDEGVMIIEILINKKHGK